MNHFWQCPTCTCRGSVVKMSPRIERVCKNGHRWAEERNTRAKNYTPATVRLQRASFDIQALLAALDRASTMIKDCSSFLTPEQNSKLSVSYELNQIELVKSQVELPKEGW